ncbi:hypothetical protein D3C73_806180 [compost metagenome]
MDAATERHDRAVGNGEGAGVVGERIDIELEVRFAQVHGIDTFQGDRLARAYADQCIAIGVVSDTQVSKAGDAREADHVDLVCRGIETVDLIVADRLGEDEGVGTGRTGQVVVSGQGEDRRVGGKGLDVIEYIGTAHTAVGVSPGHVDVEYRSAREAFWCCHGQCSGIAGLHGPGAVAVVDSGV